MKYQSDQIDTRGDIVAPHWGAWIEIPARAGQPLYTACRTPLGCVD